MTRNLIVITGPTAVGKTILSIRLAEEINGEIISADSRQVYKYMDIGTAKPTLEERKRIPHYMIDILNPDEEIDVVRYSKLAREKIDSVRKKGRVPILVGGTCLYIRGVVDGIFEGPGRNSRIRKELEDIYNEDHFKLFFKLEKIDPESANKIHHNDKQRIIRALEVYYLTGKKISSFQAQHGFNEHNYNPLFIGLFRERAELNNIINERVERMIDAGFVEEVKRLLEMGYSPSLNSMQGLGYRHITSYIMKRMNLKDAIELTKRDTRRYAKRQMTWLNKEKRIKWIKVTGKDEERNLKEIVMNHLCHKEMANDRPNF